MMKEVQKETTPRWVQHNTGHAAPKWFVVMEGEHDWCVQEKAGALVPVDSQYWLPKVEYSLCPAPERWEPADAFLGSARAGLGSGVVREIHVVRPYQMGGADHIGLVKIDSGGDMYRVVSVGVERLVRG